MHSTAINSLGSTKQTGSTIHVAPHGDDTAHGGTDTPLKTISAAAQRAMPGDTVLIHAGIYREEINPPRGGSSADTRITYTAAEGETVEIRGSELLPTWTPSGGDIWTASVDNTIFGAFNPYSDLIRGDWFRPDGRAHHTGAVYLNNQWLTEAANREELVHSDNTAGHWFAEVGPETTTFWAHFNGANPNEHEVEFNVRQSVFYPRETGIHYITISGLHLRHAATNWAPPTAEQIGLVGTNWSKGWIIENNTITHSRCTGISLGKHGDAFDNTSADTAVGYDKTIERAFQHNWDRAHVGSHIVRNNTIAYCEQAGIVGSLGAIFSQITDNTIHDIHVQGLFSGEEQAGIKIHAPIDTLIAGNHIYRTFRALWVDWMTQGTRISRNLCHNSEQEDIYIEVNHGPFIVDHNIFLSKRSIKNWSQGGAYVHNLFGGELLGEAVIKRTTPYHKPHSTELAGASDIPGGDDRFINNLVVDLDGLKKHAAAIRPCEATQGRDGLLEAQTEASIFAGNTHLAEAPQLVQTGERFELQFTGSSTPIEGSPVSVDTESLGLTKITKLPYLDFDGTALTIESDYFQNKPTGSTNYSGPFSVCPQDGQSVTL
jgi:alpha-N-arabinofuranosidase